MLRCHVCNKKLRIGDKFCKYCGTNLNHDVGKEVSKGHKTKHMKKSLKLHNLMIVACILAIVVILIIVILPQPTPTSTPTSTPSAKGGEGVKTSLNLPTIFKPENENGICEYSKGENCQNAPVDCVCKSGQICEPNRMKADNLGCYTIVCGDGYVDSGETSETCCKDAGCPSNLVCDANLNLCVKPICPYDCCENDQNYQDKSCPMYYACNSQKHSCDPIDSDNDAFPDYMEIQAGTNPYNPDTDGDTVLDGYDNHPLSSYLPRTYIYDWYYGGWLIFPHKFEFSIKLSEDVVSSYEKMPKTNLISREDPQLKEVAQIMTQLASEQGYNQADKLMMVIAFSRSFNYDYTKASFADKPLPDWANFPMETIVKKQGLCADSAVMTATLLRKMGYDARYLTSSTCRHAIIGIPYVNGITLDGSERYVIYNNQRYYYIDPTSIDYGGNIVYSTTSKKDFGKTFCQANDFVVSDY